MTPSEFVPYRGEAYHDFEWIMAWCRAAVAQFPEWLSLETYGNSRENRALPLLTLHVGGGDPRHFPAFWLDGGTHASEWAGIMSTIYTLSRWLEGLTAGDAELLHYFRHHTAYVLPCLSPDGFQFLFEGGPYLRSTKRPAREGIRQGLDPQDINGDGEVYWMRWKHPVGPFVQDEELPMLMRPRTLSDAPDNAYFVVQEGLFHFPEESGPVMAPAKFGLDLNRNFPVHWTPFAQFGMDGGEYSLSEPESRAVIDALHARPNVCAVQTNHTYTGAILASPYRPDGAISNWDQDTLHRLATEAVEGTGYRVFKVFPEFTYEPGKSIPGCWADYLTSNRGIVGYTLELWDPYAFAGVQDKDPARSFFRPDLPIIRKMVKALSEIPGTWKSWQGFTHPQLGEVEIGGLHERLTVRNPPPSLLAEECDRAHRVADRLRRAVPEVRVSLHVTPLTPSTPEPAHEQKDQIRGVSQVVVLTAVVENVGYLSTYGLSHAEKLGLVGPPALELKVTGELTCVQGTEERTLPHLTGWGDAPASFRPHPLNPVLPNKGCRTQLQWTLVGLGEAQVTYRHSRSGTVTEHIRIG